MFQTLPRNKIFFVCVKKCSASFSLAFPVLFPLSIFSFLQKWSDATLDGQFGEHGGVNFHNPPEILRGRVPKLGDVAQYGQRVPDHVTGGTTAACAGQLPVEADEMRERSYHHVLLLVRGNAPLRRCAEF